MNQNIDILINDDLKQQLSVEFANFYKIVPKSATKDLLTLYISETSYSDGLQEELEMLLDKKVSFQTVSLQSVLKALSKYYRKANADISFQSDNDFLESVISEAKSIGSSDIHFEIYKDFARIRIRIDGVLIERFRIDKNDYKELVNKVKIKANLDISEKRLPQDGRIHFQDFDIRTSILPTLYGEKIVLRILGKGVADLSLDSLGFEQNEQKYYEEAIKKENGIILISGPTGSGKTTTLYATLKMLNDIKRNIVTVEDPIEYTLDGINQVHLREDIGLTFSSALRSFLRQDPDVIMLGEIRDAETAQMAIRASLTGHLVLSTIHTNSAIGTISRLVDMGVPAFLIAETLNASVAQRLVRKLCNHCKIEVPLDKERLPSNYQMPYHIETVSESVGCEHCYYTGYSGRLAIFEVLPIDSELINQIKSNRNEINQNNIKYRTLSDKAFDLVAKKDTSLEEVYSILLGQ